MRNLLILILAVFVALFPGFFSAYGQEKHQTSNGQTQSFAAKIATSVIELMDLNKDRNASKAEYGQLFIYADRDKNGSITPKEIVKLMSENQQEEMPLFITDVADSLIQLMDVNEDKKISKIDHRAFFLRADQDSDSIVTQIELAEFILKLLQDVGPKVNEVAPDFSLVTDDDVTVKLSDRIGKTAVVLIFGNCTSPSLRSQAEALERVYQTYKAKSEWYMVYIQEANSVNESQADSDHEMETKIKNPKTMEKYKALADTCRRELGFSFPVLVDGMDDNKFRKAYAAWAKRIYVVDKKGKIAYKSEPISESFDPRKLGQKLRKICFT